MTGIPPGVRFADATTARCDICGAVMRTAQPWQLLDLARRHHAESHRPPTPTPPGVGQVLPPAG